MKEDFFDAARVCDKLGIELIQLNFAKEYKEKVFEYFLNSLKNGKTPNPDIFCNKFIKFDAFSITQLRITLIRLPLVIIVKLNKRTPHIY